MIVCGIDYETTGLNSKVDKVIEVGAVLWDCGRNTPIEIYSTFVRWEGAKLAPDHPSPHLLEMAAYHGEEPKAAFSRQCRMMAAAEAIVAHNGLDFDKLFFESWCPAEGEDLKWLKPWVDTTMDLPTTALMSRRLTYLAADHNFLNPFPHRAVFDVMTMLTICARYPWDEIIRSAREPVIKVQAVISYDDRAKAKERGYHWEPRPVGKWLKSMKLHRVAQERADAPFRVEVLA